MKKTRNETKEQFVQRCINSGYPVNNKMTIKQIAEVIKEVENNKKKEEKHMKQENVAVVKEVKVAEEKEMFSGETTFSEEEIKEEDKKNIKDAFEAFFYDTKASLEIVKEIQKLKTIDEVNQYMGNNTDRITKMVMAYHKNLLADDKVKGFARELCGSFDKSLTTVYKNSFQKGLHVFLGFLKWIAGTILYALRIVYKTICAVVLTVIDAGISAINFVVCDNTKKKEIRGAAEDTVVAEAMKATGIQIA